MSFGSWMFDFCQLCAMLFNDNEPWRNFYFRIFLKYMVLWIMLKFYDKICHLVRYLAWNLLTRSSLIGFWLLRTSESFLIRAKSIFILDNFMWQLVCLAAFAIKIFFFFCFNPQNRNYTCHVNYSCALIHSQRGNICHVIFITLFSVILELKKKKKKKGKTNCTRNVPVLLKRLGKDLICVPHPSRYRTHIVKVRADSTLRRTH